VALLWALLAILARVPATWAATVTDLLFIAALPLTFLAVVGAVVGASARPRTAALRAAALTLGLLLGLALLELAAAARMVDWDVIARVVRGEEQHYVPDPDIGFRHAPSTHQVSRLRSDVETAWGLPASRSDRITVTFDRRGYRNPTELERADLVFIGDSYVEGDYASDDEIASRLLQARLGRPVANLGVAGYGTAQELLVLKGDAVALGPKAVLWFFYEGNDLYNDHDFENSLLVPPEVRALGWAGQRSWWHRSLLHNAHAQLRLLMFPLVPRYCPHFGIVRMGPHRGRTVLFGPEAAFPWTDFERYRWERAKQTLRDAAAFTREHGIGLILIYVPIKFRVYRDFVETPPDSEIRTWTLWPLPELFQQFCRAEGLTCFDPTEPFRDLVRRGGMPYAFADSHWSPEGHRLVAERLVGMLASPGELSGPPGRVDGPRRGP